MLKSQDIIDLLFDEMVYKDAISTWLFLVHKTAGKHWGSSCQTYVIINKRINMSSGVHFEYTHA